MKIALFQILFAWIGVSRVYGGYGVIGAVRSEIDSGVLESEIDQLTQHGRKAVAITNEADDWFKIWCTSNDGEMGEKHIHQGQSMAISFRPVLNWGIGANLYCTLDYKGYWAYWHVYREFARHINVKDKVYHYTVRNDGIYIKGKKISGLASGKNRYVVWEHYDAKRNPYGRSLNGYVDSGVCNNLPDWMSDTTSAITVCGHDCVIIYQVFDCAGRKDTFRASGRCINICLEILNDKVSSVKGC